MNSITCRVDKGNNEWELVFKYLKRQFMDKIPVSSTADTILTLVVSEKPIRVEEIK